MAVAAEIRVSGASEHYFERPGEGLRPGYVEFLVGDHQAEPGIMYNPHYLEVLGSEPASSE